jgi:hypothetical protein
MTEKILAQAKTSNEKVDTLEHHPDNPRIGHVPAIVDSIRENGWFGALIGQKSTRYILAGNHRLKAAREIGIKEVPVIWVDVDDQRARKILLADNRSSDLAVYNDASLAELLASVMGDKGGEELKGTGWTEWDVARLLEKVKAPGLDDWKDYDTNIVTEESHDDSEESGLKAVVCPGCGITIQL